MTERPRPDLNRVRDAMRDHDEREESEPDLPETTDDEQADEEDEAT
jgi:hypothetical protein